MNRFKIAIIDSGIETSHPRLAKCNISGVTFLKKEERLVCLPEFGEDEIGHGTAIAAIIHRMIPDVELVGVKLHTTDVGHVSEDLMCEALNWCLLQEDIKVINISMGISNASSSERLFDLCKKAFEQNVVICAAAHNMPGQECYPAYFPFVFGVTSGHIKNKTDYGYIEGSPLNIVAKGTTQRVAWRGGSYKITSGNSFATAYFTGIAANLRFENPNISLAELILKIKKGARPEIRAIQYVLKGEGLEITQNLLNEDEGRSMFDMQYGKEYVSRVALFPLCEKEIGTILNFRDQCPYEITKYYDYPRKYKFQNLNHMLNYPVTRRITDEDFEQFDTLVVGYFLDQLFDANILFGYELIEKAIQQNKHFIIFDKDIYRYIKQQLTLPENSTYTGLLYMPYVDKNVYDRTLSYNYLPPVNVPVLLVVGTSNKQGKITTQMRLKKRLKAEGYRVAHVTTEPQGLLLGADYAFPFGHKATVSVNQDVWGLFMNAVMKGVNYFNTPHLILTGTQGQLIPRDKSHRSLYKKGSVSALHYLMGVLPDAVVCAINPEDTVEQIRNVADTIRVFSKAKLLFYVMTPWMREYKRNRMGKLVAANRLLQKEEMGERMDAFSESLGLPVIDIMDNGNDTFILKCIENAFTKKTKRC